MAIAQPIWPSTDRQTGSGSFGHARITRNLMRANSARAVIRSCLSPIRLNLGANMRKPAIYVFLVLAAFATNGDYYISNPAAASAEQPKPELVTQTGHVKN